MTPTEFAEDWRLWKLAMGLAKDQSVLLLCDVGLFILYRIRAGLRRFQRWLVGFDR